MNCKFKSVTKKELLSYFSSPIAFIFIGIFLLVSLFIFFWKESFFARNIVDVRPLFKWMPILLIFLCSALTMKSWSEERRMGTLEFLLTMPVKISSLVFGKFLACLVLVTIALFLTIGLPISVSYMGQLDWGPVIGAYVATLFLAAAYIAIGIFVSSKTDNQIVSLLVTIVLCSIFYLIGTNAITNLVGNKLGEFFRLLGTGSRFESINRGVVDLRDVYYYISIVGAFLMFTIYSLEKFRWSKRTKKKNHTLWKTLTILATLNLVLGNFCLQKTSFARADLTQGNMYSISPATEQILAQLQEPLLIRGYFSSKTHPLLSPLVPQVRDLIKEYEVRGKGKVRAEFIDPRGNAELEEEANKKYSIKPIPFQISDKYEASLVNSYFNLLIEYGDKYEVLDFQDLIEVKPSPNFEMDVQLRNLEYDLTRTIKKVLQGFKNTDSLIASLTRPVTLEGYISNNSKLPEQLIAFKANLETTLNKLKESSQGNFLFSIKEPEANAGALAKEIGEKYGFRPMSTSLFDPNPFYFYMLIKGKDKDIAIPLPESLTEEGAKKSIEGALKRLSPGFLKTIGVVAPKPKQMNPMMMQMGMQQGGKRFSGLVESLSKEKTVKMIDLSKGLVSEEVDILLVLAPEAMSEKSVFAIDQFLMKGGTVFLSTSPFAVERSQKGLSLKEYDSGLSDFLKSYGIELKKELVFDLQNEPYPIPVNRDLGGFTVQEIKQIHYPLFPDIRGEGLNEKNAVTSGVPQVTINWPSPIFLDSEKNEGRVVTELLKTSDKSWVNDSTKIEPNFSLYPDLGFSVSREKSPQIVAAMVEGEFKSFFAGKDSPINVEEKAEELKAQANEEAKEVEPVFSGKIEKSPNSARLIVFSSNEFLEDTTLQVSASAGNSRFLNSLQLVENAVDWSLEDRGLLTIRGRGKFSRTLLPLTDKVKFFWECLNYFLVLIGLGIVYLVYKVICNVSKARYKEILA